MGRCAARWREDREERGKLEAVVDPLLRAKLALSVTNSVRLFVSGGHIISSYD